MTNKEVLIQALQNFEGEYENNITDYNETNDISEVIDYSAYPVSKPERPQGEREFIEILAEYCEDDYDTLPEYRGKPYYSIHYRENGEEFVGYGTYKIEVLSEYLRNYFFIKS